MKHKILVGEILSTKIELITLKLIAETPEDTIILNERSSYFENYLKMNYNALEVTLINSPYFTFKVRRMGLPVPVC